MTNIKIKNKEGVKNAVINILRIIQILTGTFSENIKNSQKNYKKNYILFLITIFRKKGKSKWQIINTAGETRVIKF